MLWVKAVMTSRSVEGLWQRKPTGTMFLLFCLILAAVGDPEQSAANPAGTGLSREEISQIATLHPSLYAWSLACCGRNRDDAGEVLQRSYEKLLNGKARFDGRSEFKTWICGVIRFTAMEYRRTEWMRQVKASILGREEKGSKPGPERLWMDRERENRLVQAMDQLPARQKEVLHLVFQQDMTIAEASVVMDVSLGSARVHYERGKKRLAELLGQEGSDEQS